MLTGAGRGCSSGADRKSAGAGPYVDGLTRTTYALRSIELLDDVILTLRQFASTGDRRGQWSSHRWWAKLGIGGCCPGGLRHLLLWAASINNRLIVSQLGLSYLLPRDIGSSRAVDIMLAGRSTVPE